MVTNKPVSTSKSAPAPAPAKKAATPAGKDGAKFIDTMKGVANLPVDDGLRAGEFFKLSRGTNNPETSDQTLTIPPTKPDNVVKNAVRDAKDNTGNIA